MSNCQVKELLSVYEASVMDALISFPQLANDFKRDLVRLRRLSQQLGLALFTVHLPAIGKHLDRCLSEEKYSLSLLPLGGRASTRSTFPKFLRGLLLLVFDESGLLRKEDCNVEAIIFLRQFLYCAKKIELLCQPEFVTAEVADFISVDSALPLPETVWAEEAASETTMTNIYQGFSSGRIGLVESLTALGTTSAQAILFARNLDMVSGFIATTLGAYLPEEWRFKHGPGAIAEKSGPVNKYHWYNWSDRLEGRFPIADYGYHSYGSWANSVDGDKVGSHEPASRLIAVPKTFLKPRLIAAEPSSNQWCQQNIWHYLRVRSKGSWINNFVRFGEPSTSAHSLRFRMEKSELNQVLCRKGSQDGSLVTVDLKAASDRVTCAVVGEVFRSNPRLLCALQAVRTRFLEIRNVCEDIPPQVIELRKFSTMGSACTFPIQSLVFLAITLAAALTSRGKGIPIPGIRATYKGLREKEVLDLIGEVAVFGDDIIAPKDSWELLHRALECLHFKVNETKTYTVGNFRESCGLDAFRGVDVTPVYYKGICDNKQPESIASTLAVANNFHRKWFISTADYLLSTMRATFAPVSMDSGVLGKQSFVRPELSDLKIRWNRDLQRAEALTSVLSSHSMKMHPRDDSVIHQFLTEDPAPGSPWEPGVSSRPRTKMRRGWVPLELLGVTAWT